MEQISLNHSISFEAKILHKYMPLLKELISSKTHSNTSTPAIIFYNEKWSSKDIERRLSLKIPSSQTNNINYPLIFNGTLLTDIIKSGNTSNHWVFTIQEESLNQGEKQNKNDKTVQLTKDKFKVDFTLMKDTLLQENHSNAIQTPDNENIVKYILPAKTLHNAIKSIQFSIGDSDNLPILKGISLKFSQAEDDALKIEFIATNGYQIANYSIHIKNEYSNISNLANQQITLSQKTFITLMHLLETCTNNDISFSIKENNIVFEGITDDKIEYTFQSTLLAGNFPDCSTFLNKNTSHTSYVCSDELLAGIKQAAIMAKDNQIVHLEFHENHILIKSGNVNLGHCQIEITSNLQTNKDNDKADDISPKSNNISPISFNLKINFLTQILQIFGKNNIKIHITPNKPLLFSCDQMPELLYLLLPLYNGNL